MNLGSQHPEDVRKKGSKILKLPPVGNCFTLAMTNKLVVIINSLKVPKVKKSLLYEMKFLVPNYSCLQNLWLGDYRPQISVLSVLNWISWTSPSLEKKFLGTPLERCNGAQVTEPTWFHPPAVSGFTLFLRVVRFALRSYIPRIYTGRTAALYTRQYVLSANYLHEFHGILNWGSRRKAFEKIFWCRL